MSWFATHGAKLLSFLTGVAGLATTMHESLHISEDALAWVTFGAAVLTLSHTVFFPNQEKP